MDIKEIAKLFDLSASIDFETADLQTKTCMQIIDMLDDVPGVILGDDVGMGKTYVAIGIAVWFLSKYPEKPIIIITPSWLLNSKWYNDIRNFMEKNLHSDKVKLTKSDVVMIEQGRSSYICQIADAAKSAKIILVPTNVFSSMGWKYEKSFFLSCWFKHRRFWGRTRENILEALGGDTNVFAPEEFIDMGVTYKDIPECWYTELDRIYQEEGISQAGVNAIWNGIKELRYKVINKIMPESSLLILDEAHKVKNEESVKRKALESAMFHNFDKGIFLTATPFQLGEGELMSILNMFKSANITDREIGNFEGVVSKLFFEMKKYKELMSVFENYVRYMSPDESIQLEDAIKSGIKSDLGYDIKETYTIYEELQDQKVNLESVMKRLIVRNIKNKDKYRNEITGSLENNDYHGIPLSNESYIPFALMEKAIYQILANGDRTFISNVKQSFTSSFSAAKNTSIYGRDIEAMNMLRKINLDKIMHPKLNTVADEVADALMNGEKTLLFCDRIETIKQLKECIEHRLNRSYTRDIKKLFPENGLKGFDNYCRRFTNKQDISWFLLQENYIHSVLMPVLKICGGNKSCIPIGSDISDEVIRTYKNYNATIKTNYMYIKRIVEQIAFKKALKKIEGWEKQLAEYPELLETVNHILDPRYIILGLNLTADLEEEDTYEEGDYETRNISVKLINDMINYKGIWYIYRDKLNNLKPDERDVLVSSMISFLRRDKRFLIKLRYAKENYPQKDDSILVYKTFANGNLLDWENAYQRFLDRYCGETTVNREEMRFGLYNSDVVATITGNTDNKLREKIKAGFNTPFYPQILIATSTMQEGIDLQTECKRVFHYDLEWNPASMEQRVGRVDRIGSLISKLREKNNNVTLDIYSPYIKNTIDESIFNTVKDREKWFNLILGGTPQWDTFEIDPDVTNIKPWVFRNLQIDLSVKG